MRNSTLSAVCQRHFNIRPHLLTNKGRKRRGLQDGRKMMNGATLMHARVPEATTAPAQTTSGRDRAIRHVPVVDSARPRSDFVGRLRAVLHSAVACSDGSWSGSGAPKEGNGMARSQDVSGR